MLLMERVSPTNVAKGGFASAMRLAGGVGITAGFLLAYSKSISTSAQLRVVHGLETTDYTNYRTLTNDYRDLQTASTASPRTVAKSTWTCAKWSTKSRRASLCTARANSPNTCKASQADKADTLVSGSMSCRGSTWSTTTRCVARLLLCHMTFPCFPLLPHQKDTLQLTCHNLAARCRHCQVLPASREGA